jgi:hypothetical protein
VEALRIAKVEAPTFSDIRFIDGGKVVTPEKFLVLISVRG